MTPHRRHLVAASALIASIATVLPSYTATASEQPDPGAIVYTETNSTTGNAVIALQLRQGVLSPLGTFAAGGRGSGKGLGSQGALTIANNKLFAVDAGSDQLSLFDIADNGSLRLTDVVSSGGVGPVSVTVADDVAYVLNAGDRTVSGFRIDGGSLVGIAGSTQALPGNGGAQVSFDRTGRRLLVTEKATSTIDVLAVRAGVAQPAVSTASSGQTPFGFAIDQRNHVIVSNAAGGAPGASSLTSYALTGTALSPISAAVPDTQSAACWVVLAGLGRYAYTTNTGSGTVSSYRVGADGTLTLAQAVAATTGTAPIDASVAAGHLLTLNSGSHTISADRIGADGSLAPTGQAAVPTGVVGLASTRP